MKSDVDRSALMQQHLGLALFVAGKWMRKHPDLAEEIRSAAMLALAQAAWAFDPSHPNASIAPLICIRVKWAAATVVREARRHTERFPVADPLHDHERDEDVPAVELLFVEPAPQQDPARAAAAHAVRRAIEALPEREAQVVRERYLEERTLAAAGATMGIRKQSAAAIEARALHALHARLVMKPEALRWIDRHGS